MIFHKDRIRTTELEAAYYFEKIIFEGKPVACTT